MRQLFRTCPTVLSIAALVTCCLCCGVALGQHSHALPDRAVADPGAIAGPGDETPAVTDLLADGVTRQEAVTLALLHNSQLRSHLAKLGIARADLVQAGLYSNPELDVVLRFPEGERGNDLEVEALWNVANLWRVPLRKQMARAELERTTADVSAAILNTIADARRAHDQCVILEAILAEAMRVLAATEDLRDRLYLRFDYGYTTELDKASADAEVGHERMHIAESEAAVKVATAGLRRVIGLNSESLEVTGELPEPPAAMWNDIDFVTHALAHRPDYRAAQLGVRVATASVALERKSKWRHVSLGPAYANEPDGGELWGLALSVDLPVTDGNRGMRAKAGGELHKSRADLEALAAQIREQVTVAQQRLELATARERLLRETIVPAHQRAVDYTTKHYNQMQLNLADVLEQRVALHAARKEHLMARLDVQSALVELEFVLGGTLPVQPSAHE